MRRAPRHEFYVGKPKFELGRLVVTANAQRRLHIDLVLKSIIRHSRGDWGDCYPEDAAANERALLEDERVMSVYRITDSTECFWIITEANRSATTVLLPEDY